MFLRRTTNGLVSACRIAAAWVLAVASAHAAEGGISNVRLSYLPSTASGGSLVVSGIAPARCAPAAESVALDGNELGIVLKTPEDGCSSTRWPFRLSLASEQGLPNLTRQVYRVRVYDHHDGDTSTLASFSLLDTTQPAVNLEPENGFWWSEASTESGAATGNGASIEVQGNQIAVGLFGFTSYGAPTWYFGSASLDGRLAHVALVQLANGDSSFTSAASSPSAEAGPRLEIEFLSPSRARVYVVHNQDGRDTNVGMLSLSRAHFASGGPGATWSGRWVLIAGDETTAHVLDFGDAVREDAENFRLTDAGNDATLECRLAPGTSHPDSCTLSSADASLMNFDQIGLDHLTGQDIGGTPARLIRIPR